MRVAVYAIAKNEADNVLKFAQSAKEADHVCVLDTGSTDGTFELLKQNCSIVKQATILPWRYDAARNMALKLVPKDVDVVVSVDLDERFPKGWRKKLEEVWQANTTMLKIRFVYSWKPDGTPDRVYRHSRVHLRNGYIWTRPCHECLTWHHGKGPEVVQNTNEVELHHFQNNKPRTSYLPLLELGAKEDPSDERMSHYLAREYMLVKRWPECITESLRHLDLPRATWAPERAMSCSFIARSFEALQRPAEAEQWYLKACAEYEDREHWIRLAQFYFNRKFWAGAYGAAMRGLQFTERPELYMCEPACWGAWPYDLAGCAAFNLQLNECLGLLAKAAALAPNDKRIAANLESALKKYSDTQTFLKRIIPEGK